MPTVRHPRALDEVTGHPPAGVTVRGESFDVAREDAPATVELPDERHVRALADAYDLDADALRLNQHDGERGPEALVNDGECPWCDDYEGDHVGQHASSAHPDEWDAFDTDD